MKLLVAGASTSEICGVRDCADVLAPALEAAGATLEQVWWNRSARAGTRSTIREAKAFADDLRSREADAIVWHYSVFSYGPRGIPVATPVVARRLRGGAPVVGFLHELAFPWGARGLRGTTQALTQRAALRPLFTTLVGGVVTTERRRAWLGSSRLVPRIPLSFLPVPSNLPVAPSGSTSANGALRIGVFGFGSDGNDVATATAAVADLRRRGVDARLALVGAPGPGSPQARRWLDAAGAAGFADAVTVTGIEAPAPLSATLQALDIVLLPDRSGPTARRGSLAAALAHGRPVVAFDGPARWDDVVEGRALVLAPANSAAVADELERLARDEGARKRQGERARAFYERTMSAEVVARGLLSFVGDVTP